jgi:hypothetical protein
VGFGVGEYLGEGVGVKPATTGIVTTGVGLADFWRSVVGSALGLTNRRTVGLATSCVGATVGIGVVSVGAPTMSSTNRKNPMTKSPPIP